MTYFRRRTKIITTISALVLVAGVVAFVVGSGDGIPQEFTDARSRGALVAQSIVTLSTESTDALEEINRLDRQGRLSEALALTEGLMENNDTLRNKALELSEEIETMTRSLERVRNDEAQEIALGSISNRLAMITELIGYSNHFEELISVLQGKFSGNRVPDARPVNTIINDINAQVEAINNFDIEAQDAIQRFDTIIGEDA